MPAAKFPYEGLGSRILPTPLAAIRANCALSFADASGHLAFHGGSKLLTQRSWFLSSRLLPWSHLRYLSASAPKLHGSMFQHLETPQSCHRQSRCSKGSLPVFASGNHLWCIRIWSMGLPALAAWFRPWATWLPQTVLFTAKLSAIFLVSPPSKKNPSGVVETILVGELRSPNWKLPSLQRAKDPEVKSRTTWPSVLWDRCWVKFFHGKSTICWVLGGFKWPFSGVKG